jgi:peptidoglycan hydrolase-like protein with peptidoglycan-binding domain
MRHLPSLLALLAMLGGLACGAPEPRPVSVPDATGSHSAAAPQDSDTSPGSEAVSTSGRSSTTHASTPAPSTALPAAPPSASPLIRHTEGFTQVRAGRPLKIGSKGPEVAALQAILLFWNYPLEPSDVTGSFDAATAKAVFSYRIDLGLEAIPPRGTFAEVALTRGVFDGATLDKFQARMEAQANRAIQQIDPRRGVRFDVPRAVDDERILGRAYSDYQEIAQTRPRVVTRDPPKPAEATRAAWVPLREYACVVASGWRGKCAP